MGLKIIVAEDAARQATALGVADTLLKAVEWNHLKKTFDKLFELAW